MLTVRRASATASKNPLAKTCNANGDLAEANRIVYSRRSYLSSEGRSPYAPAISGDVLWKVRPFCMRLMAVSGYDSCRLAVDSPTL